MTVRNREFAEDFKQEAVCLSDESGLTVAQVAKGLGIGKSPLSTWRRNFSGAALAATADETLEQENARLRRENQSLRQERELLKKATAFFAQETKR